MSDEKCFHFKVSRFNGSKDENFNFCCLRMSAAMIRWMNISVMSDDDADGKESDQALKLILTALDDNPWGTV